MFKRVYTEPVNRLHPSNEEIEAILNGCRRNQRAEQKQLYKMYYRFAMSIAMRYSTSHDNALEMTNDAFLRIFSELKNFTPMYNNLIATFMAWAKKIVIYACIDHIRKYNKKEMMIGADLKQAIFADERETAEQMLQHKEIIKCIQQLSPAYKAVFNLYVIEGFSHAEIAIKLNISEGTSKSNLYKARQNLQELLKQSNSIHYEKNI